MTPTSQCKRTPPPPPPRRSSPSPFAHNQQQKFVGNQNQGWGANPRDLPSAKKPPPPPPPPPSSHKKRFVPPPPQASSGYGTQPGPLSHMRFSIGSGGSSSRQTRHKKSSRYSPKAAGAPSHSQGAQSPSQGALFGCAPRPSNIIPPLAHTSPAVQAEHFKEECTQATAKHKHE